MSTNFSDRQDADLMFYQNGLLKEEIGRLMDFIDYMALRPKWNRYNEEAKHRRVHPQSSEKRDNE